MRQVVGVACITVALLALSCAMSGRASAAVSREAITTLAPLISGRNNSSAAISNEIVVTAFRQRYMGLH